MTLKALKEKKNVIKESSGKILLKMKSKWHSSINKIWEIFVVRNSRSTKGSSCWNEVTPNSNSDLYEWKELGEVIMWVIIKDGNNILLLFLFWECKIIQSYYKTIDWQFFNMLKIELPYVPAILILAIYTWEEIYVEKTYTSIFKVTLLITARVKIVQLFIKRWIHKENTAYLNTRILLKNEQITHVYFNLNEILRHYAKWKMLVTK